MADALTDRIADQAQKYHVRLVAALSNTVSGVRHATDCGLVRCRYCDRADRYAQEAEALLNEIKESDDYRA